MDDFIRIYRDEEQKHMMYRPLGPDKLHPEAYLCVGCRTEFPDHDAFARHRAVKVIQALLTAL